MREKDAELCARKCESFEIERETKARDRNTQTNTQIMRKETGLCERKRKKCVSVNRNERGVNTCDLKTAK